ncbi:MAG: hypothetical protein IT369_12430 [Candidatus Latescibacteria bacterium]|nr:hypothetical protein [Candidatus Latescibacterota bacterium]
MDPTALAQLILDLENDEDRPLEDEVLASGLAAQVKEDIDQLVALKQGQDDAEGEGEGEDETLGDLSEAAEGTEIFGDELADPEDAADQAAAQEERRAKAQSRQSTPSPLPSEPPDLRTQPPQDQAHWIFMERFISLPQHEEALGYTFTPENLAAYQDALGGFVEQLLRTPRAADAFEGNDLPALQKLFASHLLFFRNPVIGDGAGRPIPCSLDALRERFPGYLYRKSDNKPNWYQKYRFYSEPLSTAQWVLCDSQHLNCTFRTPDRKLVSYAKSWDLPAEWVHGKTILEDIYDRILCGEVLGEDLFAGSHNSCTLTTYVPKKKTGVKKMVYAVQKIHKISLHGKEGVPHWRASRRLWPGVLPTIHFS